MHLSTEGGHVGVDSDFHIQVELARSLDLEARAEFPGHAEILNLQVGFRVQG